LDLIEHGTPFSKATHYNMPKTNEPSMNKRNTTKGSHKNPAMNETPRMSFLHREVSLTRHRLNQAVQVPPSGSWQAHHLANMMNAYREVRVELHGAWHRTCEYVDTMPAWLLYLFDPQIFCRVNYDPRTHQFIYAITIPSTEYSAEIEIPALCWVFGQMRGVANCLPAHDSIGQATLLYRALQLLNFANAASDLRTHLMEEIYQNPLAAYDVQRIWWAFHRTSEWPEWLHLLLANLARFHVYDNLREYSYIRYFIETEVWQLSEPEQHKICEIHSFYLYREPVPAPGPVDRARMAIGKGRKGLGKGWGKLTCAPSMPTTRRERELID
jgi:hypothetical protein